MAVDPFRKNASVALFAFKPLPSRDMPLEREQVIVLLFLCSMKPFEEVAMGFLPFGGFVFSIDGGNYQGTARGIGDATFEQIAKILNIPPADIAQLIAHRPRSVYVYRGTPAELAPFVPVVGGGGGGSGGGGSAS